MNIFQMEQMEQEIDLVYLWVDGNDPKWLEKRKPFLNKEINPSGRYKDNQELRYSLRSLEKNLPWIRKIFIVTDDQVPSFVDENHPKIQIVNHSEIIPKEILPTFNSVIIEYFIYKIPDLSEHFIYSNDDTFVSRPLPKSFFFKDGLPIVRMRYDALHKIKLKIKKLLNIRINNYRLSIENSFKLIEKKYGVYYPGTPHHNLDAYLKSSYKEVVEDVFKEELNSVLGNRFRDKTDIQRILFHYYNLATNKGHLKFVDRKESCRIMAERPDYDRYMKKYNPTLFCLNDTEHATEEDRARIVPFLEKLFPEKTEFEK